MNREEALSVIEQQIIEVEKLKEKLKEIDDTISHVRRTTQIGDYLRFPVDNMEEGQLQRAIRIVDRFIELKDEVKVIKDELSKSEEFEIGDILSTADDKRIPLRRVKPGNSSVYEVNMDPNIHANYVTIYAIVGKENGKYVLAVVNASFAQLVIATHEQLLIYFKKVGKLKKNVYKVEFSLSGPKMKYSNLINEIRVYPNGCKNRIGGDWGFNTSSYNIFSSGFDYSADESFGIMATAYFIHDTDKFDFKDIIIKFGEQRFILGFSKLALRDSYKYNGCISLFSRKSKKGNDEDYLPKDVFESGVRSRLLNVLSVSKVYEAAESND